jgi:hypothetical protein
VLSPVGGNEFLHTRLSAPTTEFTSDDEAEVAVYCKAAVVAATVAVLNPWRLKNAERFSGGRTRCRAGIASCIIMPACTCCFFFAFTGLLLNHGQWAFAEFWANRQQNTSQHEIVPPAPGSDVVQPRELMRQLGIDPR